MGFLKLALALALLSTLAAGCYSPQLADCAVQCKTADDCGPDQACGSDGWCAGSDELGRCDDPMGGGGSGDPAATSQLRLVISGLGEVEVLSNAESINTTCTASGASDTCTYQVRPGAWVSLREKSSGGWRFSGWDSPGCTMGRPKSCLVRVSDVVTTAGARFEGGEDDDD